MIHLTCSFLFLLTFHRNVVIDDLTDSSKPVIMPMAVECVAHEAKLNLKNDGQPDVQDAGADFYSTALKKDQALGDDVTLPGMAGCAEDDLYFAAGDSFFLSA